MPDSFSHVMADVMADGRQEQARGQELKIEFSGQGTEDSRTAGTVGEQDGRGLAAGVGQTLPCSSHKRHLSRICISSDNVWLPNVI